MRGKKAKAIRQAAARINFHTKACKRHLQRHHPNLPVAHVYPVLQNFYWSKHDGGQ